MLDQRNQFGHPTELKLQISEQGIQKVHNQNRWDPYELNGGNIMALARDDFAVFAADTRMSRGYSILHRDITKVHKLTEDTYLLTAGMYADTINLWQILDQQIQLYQMDHGKVLSSKGIATYLSRLLY